MLIRTYFYPAHSISSLKNVAMLSFTIKKSMFICVFSLYPSNTTTQPPSVSTNVVVDPTILLLIPVLCQRYCSLGKVCNMKPSRRLTFSWFLSNLSTFRGFNEFPNSISNGDTVPCTVKKKKEKSQCKCEIAKFLGLCTKLPHIYQCFCKEERPNSCKNETPQLKWGSSPPVT